MYSRRRLLREAGPPQSVAQSTAEATAAVLRRQVNVPHEHPLRYPSQGPHAAAIEAALATVEVEHAGLWPRAAPDLLLSPQRVYSLSCEPRTRQLELVRAFEQNQTQHAFFARISVAEG